MIENTVHAVIRDDHGGMYTAECLEIAVVTQGRTLDEVVHNLKEAVALHLEGEDLSSFGFSEYPRIQVNLEMAAAS